jgi:hypothetical protein
VSEGTRGAGWRSRAWREVAKDLARGARKAHPAGQEVHDVEPLEGEYLPAGQFGHDVELEV